MGRKKKTGFIEVNMKVLYIAPYRTGTDYTDAAINYILALDSIGVDVVPRCSYQFVQNIQIPDKIKELEKKNVEGCDYLIIHGPPAHFEYHAGFKGSLGITCVETNDFRASTWPNKLNLMSSIVVANKDAKKACELSNVKTPIHVLPYTVDVNKYLKSYPVMKELKDLSNNDFLFYVIARSNKRKNIIEILRAFHSEFRLEEPVNILIKTGSADLPTEITRNEMRKITENVKRDLRLHPKSGGFKTELIVTEWLSDDDLCSLHNSADCYIAMSANESFCMPAFDAMAFGKTPLFLSYTGYKQYLRDGDTGFEVNHYMDNCFGFVGNSEVYTANEEWAKPDIKSLRKQMRMAYELKRTKNTLIDDMVSNGLEKAYEFSYEKVGNQLRELLLNEQQK